MSSESLDYFEIQIVRHSFRTKRSSENLKKLDEIKDKIQKKHGKNSFLVQELLRAYIDVYLHEQEYDNVFKAGIQLINLTIQDYQEMSVEDNIDLSVQMCIAAIFGKNTFNIKEFIDEHYSVFNSLLKTQFEPLHQIVSFLAQGKINEFKSSLASYKDQIDKMHPNAFASLGKEPQVEIRKVRMIAVYEAVMQQGEEMEEIDSQDVILSFK
jgi:hypothetical protein